MKSKYINSFDTSSALETYLSGDVIDYPNIAYVKATGNIVYTDTPSMEGLRFDKSVYNITFDPYLMLFGSDDVLLIDPSYGYDNRVSIIYNGTDVTSDAMGDVTFSRNENWLNNNYSDEEDSWWYITWNNTENGEPTPGTYSEEMEVDYEHETATATINMTVPDYIIPDEGKLQVNQGEGEWTAFPDIYLVTSSDRVLIDNGDITWTVTSDPNNIISSIEPVMTEDPTPTVDCWKINTSAAESMTGFPLAVFTASCTVNGTTYQTKVGIELIEVIEPEEENRE